MHRCGICGGELALLGVLGCLVWTRCVCCGMQYSIPAEELEDGEIEGLEDEDYQA